MKWVWLGFLFITSVMMVYSAILVYMVLSLAVAIGGK